MRLSSSLSGSLASQRSTIGLNSSNVNHRIVCNASPSHSRKIAALSSPIGPSPQGIRLYRQPSVLSRSISAVAPPTSGSDAHATISPSPSPKLKRNLSAPSFQEAIKRLQSYWSSIGCAVWLPHNTEVGAGTMNPATFLRVLGPEPWNVCYAEPSIRPDDSRYGDNPNRLQRHTQFQVILKPDPGNSQELYLGSLEALGIDTKAHDVRFVEDNWESPVLGAWGLGWEVWLDGMEVTQFTYFQQAGGKTLDAPAVEITYGMERIMMALQGVTNFKDIQYTEGGISYGELFLQNEYEMSRYNLDEADIEEQRMRFDLYDKEARRMLAKRLPVPAYDHLLKLSHTFNLLDARGAVGVTERANCFAVMRGLAREVTGLWIARREELGHPLGVLPPTPPPHMTPLDPTLLPNQPQTFVLEIGTEELPPDDVHSSLEQLSSRLPVLLAKLRLSHEGQVRVEGTPRRLAVMIEGLAPRQAADESKVRGPPASSAFGKDGKTPTKALEGFCRKNNVDASQVTRETDGKGVEYVFALVKDAGRAAGEVLVEELPLLISSLSYKKSMKWNPGGPTFSRPIRWILAMHGSSPLPFISMGLASGSTTRVLRTASHPQVPVPSAEAYESLVRSHGITLGVKERKESIWAGVRAKATEVDGTIPEATRGDLLEEVANLVESPTIVLGTFASTFLQLPEEVLVMVMRKHQRYFPVYSTASSKLLPYFITVANGAVDVEQVALGNEAVLRARFEDATFFYREDMEQKLEDFRPKLKGAMFQKDLGSLLDKSNRVEAMISPLASLATIASKGSQGRAGMEGAVETAEKAASLSRADLATSVVTEMTALAGTMGRHYAYQQGLPPDLAEAIFESVLPRQSGDKLPSSPAGILVAVADRIDSIVGLFAAGCAPSAAADPYALRRAAYGMLQTCVGNGVSLSLRSIVDLAAKHQPLAVSEEVKGEVLGYLAGRMEQLLVDAGNATEAVRAVLVERGDDPSLAVETCSELRNEWTINGAIATPSPRLKTVMQALGRPTRIVRGKEVDLSLIVNPSLFDCDEERALFGAYERAQGRILKEGGAGRVTLNVALDIFAQELEKPVDAFFEKVFVMCEDEGVRRNRLALMRDLAGLTKGLIEFSELPGF